MSCFKIYESTKGKQEMENPQLPRQRRHFRFDEEDENRRQKPTSNDKDDVDDYHDESASDDDDHYFRQPPAAGGSKPPPPGHPAPQKPSLAGRHHRANYQSHSQKKVNMKRADEAAAADNNTSNKSSNKQRRPSLEPYLTRLEKFELFSTHQCYYLVACDKHSTGYRIMKMDRTLIERPKGTTGSTAPGNNSSNHIVTDFSPTIPDQQQQQQQRQETHFSGNSNTCDNDTGLTTIVAAEAGTTSSPTRQQQQPPLQQSQNQQSFRRLSDFLFEDPAVYTESEIKDILDMINDGNRVAGAGAASAGAGEVDYYYSSSSSSYHQHLYSGVSGSGSRDYDAVSSHHSQGGHYGGGQSSSDHSINRTMSRQGGGGGSNNNNGGGGGLKPICKAYGVLGFIRFLDCYYLTLITKRAKVGCIGGNSIYTIKNTETFPLKPAERTDSSSSASENAGNDPLGLLSMWQRGKRSVGLGLTNREIAELRYQGE